MKRYVKEYIRDNLQNISVVLFCIVIGIIVGIFIFNLYDENRKEEIIIQARNTVSLIKEDNFDSINVLVNGIKQNVITVLVIYFSTLTFLPLLFVLLISLLKGICIGVYISLLLYIFGIKFGILLVIFLVIIPNIVFIASYIYISNNSLVFHIKIKESNISFSLIFSEIIRVILGMSILVFSTILEQLIIAILTSNYVIKYLT